MNSYKLGTNFDFDLLNLVNETNQKHDNAKITEMYGSIRKHADLAARPDFRLPDITFDTLKKYVKQCNDYNIIFNYTFNSINPCESKRNLYNNIGYIKHFVRYLINIGVSRFTVANPMLLEIIRSEDNNIPIEVSTIAHIDTITQIKFYKDTYNVDKICCNLNKNRDFEWLRRAAEYCNNNNILLELMVNEFCGVGAKSYATHCIYRDSCYICHSTNKSRTDALLYNEYPMNRCTLSRNTSPVNWLRVKFIRPEDIHYYNEIGIYNFKITGRTASKDYLEKMLNAYLNESFEGNLLNLWKPLESIAQGKAENFAVTNIDNKKLNGFLDKWAYSKHCCDYEVCGETCTYCEDFYKKVFCK